MDDVPVTVNYEVRQDETNIVETTGSKDFESNSEYYSWLRSQSGHPFLHINIVSVVPREPTFSIPAP